jgi:phage tail sheath protein FI
MVTVSYPGVYTQEIPSGVHTITGAPTSVALFVGKTADGPIDRPLECLKPAEFTNVYGDDLADDYQLPRYVRLFFRNGGSDCWVLRVTSAASQANAAIETQALSAATTALVISALYPGVRGGQIRVAIDYNTTAPDSTFNLTAFRLETDARGERTRKGQEVWTNLTMDASSPQAAVSVVTSRSALASAAPGSATAGTSSFSMAGRVFDPNAPGGTAIQQLDTLLNSNGLPRGKIAVTLSGLPTVVVDLADPSISYASESAWATSVGTAIGAAFNNISVPGIAVTVSFAQPPGSAVTVITFTPTGPAPNGYDIQVSALPGGNSGLLMLGAATGGVEMTRFSEMRPAPNGISWDLAPHLPALASLDAATTAFDALALALDGTLIPIPKPTPPGAQTKLFGIAADGASGVSAWLDAMIQAINWALLNAQPPIKWRAQRWGYRLVLAYTLDSDTAMPATMPPSFSGGNAAATLLNNTARQVANTPLYVLGVAGRAIATAVPGTAGGPLQQSDYDAAFALIDRTIPIFNTLSLPPDGWNDDKGVFLGSASAFCLQRNAVLLIDPPRVWMSRDDARSGVDALRIGVAIDHAALYFPRIKILENGVERPLGPAGAVAGVMTRIDNNRGVWKASAGLEANLLGISGVAIDMSDSDNGVLNPLAVNAIRKFPDGIVLWGARTLAGDDRFGSEYKYLPIRRMSNFLRLSLLNSLGWVVFEPNDEPLWAQIRLNVGAFMNTYFRRRAFQGDKPTDAYFVRCDSETTTQDDRNNGIVNIWVGFAPLKPAEFVVVSIQQMAGQIQV